VLAFALGRLDGVPLLDPPERSGGALSDFETSTGGTWRLCAVVDYATKYCLAATVSRFMRGIEAETRLLQALAQACRCIATSGSWCPGAAPPPVAPAGRSR